MSSSQWLSSVGMAVTTCLAAVSLASAQPRQPVDPSQYPELVKSKVFQRWWWAFQQRAYPLGYIPAGAKPRALESIARTKAANAQSVAAIPGGTWFNVGPAPMLGGQIGQTLPTRQMSGRITAIAADRGNANRWLVGAAQGGVWETRDAGVTWTAKTDAQASLAMGAIAVAPSDPSIVYVGTGEANFSGDSYAGAGLLKSTDGGNTWSLLATGSFAQSTFSAIRVDPDNPNTVVAGTSFGFAGRVPVFPPAPPAGIFRSTDGGGTWARTRSGDASDLAVDPTNFNNQFAGMGDDFSDPSNNLVRSTDGGQSWSAITGPWTQPQIGRISLAIAPSNPNTMYVAIQRAFGSGGGSAEGALLGLFRTDNAWASTPTFVSIPQPAATGAFGFCGWNLAYDQPSQQCNYDMVIASDPADANTVYAGGIELWKCTNCGAAPTWVDVSKTASDPGQGIHVDQHALAWAGARLIAGNDGGVWSTTDGGVTWADHNTTLSTTQFYDGSLHPTDPNFALGGNQDNGTVKWTGTGAWTVVAGGDGMANAISSSRPNTDWAVSFQNLFIIRTTDGDSFIEANGGIDTSDAPFVARFEKCSANDDIFVAGTTKVWRTDDFFSAPAGPSWSDNNSGTFAKTSTVTALGFASADSGCNTYAFGMLNGSLGFTANGGLNWTVIASNSVLPGRAVTDLAFHPTDPNTVYVTFSGFDEGTPQQPGHVFKTTNALSPAPTWTNVSPPVNLPHNTVAIDPRDPNTVYVGTDLGVWKSIDGGASWNHMGPEVGMPNVAVFDLKINAATNRLVAFTHGRGAFALSSAGPALFSSVLPTSRSVQVGKAATVFATVLNAGVATATGVNISLRSSIPAGFSAQTTDPVTNQVTGPPNTPLDIPGGQSQTYVLAITPSAPFGPTDVQFDIVSTNGASIAPLTGINTLLLSGSIDPTPDVIALAATSPNTGILRIPGASGAAAFAIATSNVGAGGLITVSADTGSAVLPLVLTLCQTNPNNGQCTSAIGSTVTIPINSAQTPTFGVFAAATGSIALDPAANRIFVRLKDASGVTRGSTSVAVRTE